MPSFDLYPLLPEKYLELDVDYNLKKFIDIINLGISAPYDKILSTHDYPLLREEWFAKAWCEVIGFPELPKVFVWEDLKLVLPFFMRLIKMKGTMAPIIILTEQVFSDIEPFEYTMPEEITSSTTEFYIDIDVTTVTISKINGIPPSAYLGSKVRALNLILQRFVPPYLDFEVRIIKHLGEDLYSFEIDDEDLRFRAVVPMSDTYGTLFTDTDISHNLRVPVIENFVLPDTSGEALWNDFELNDDEMGGSTDVPGLFDDDDLVIELI